MSYKLECEMNDEILKLRKQLEEWENGTRGRLSDLKDRETLLRKLDIALDAIAHAIVLLDSGYAVMTVPNTKIYLLEKLAEIEKVNNE